MTDSMKLPDGKACSDCHWFKRCVALFGCKPTNTSCDWAPSRFLQLAPSPDKNQGPNPGA